MQGVELGIRSKPLPRILCVDDEERILNAIVRSLRGSLDVSVAGSGAQALEIMRDSKEPFQVVVSDMKMPEMSGATFLAISSREFPSTVRILLTGFAEVENVARAINEGNIYRFLSKPCSTAELMSAIKDGIRQYELINSEKVLLEQTLRASIQAMTDVLALASPTHFGRAARIKQLAMLIAAEAGITDTWMIDVVAHLSQIGRITLPDSTAAKIAAGEPLSEIESAMLERVPQVTRSILERIPRLDAILEVLEYIDKNYDGSGIPRNKVAGEYIPEPARVLKLAGRVEDLHGRGYSARRVLDTLRIESSLYEPRLLRAFEAIADTAEDLSGPRGVAMHELRIGMIVAEPVRSRAGVMLVAAGQEVSETLLGRIQNYHDTIGLDMPLWIRPKPVCDESLEPQVSS